MKLLFALLLIVLSGTPAFAAATMEQEIEHLLDFVRHSDCQLERNGAFHNGTEAVEHIGRKYHHFKTKIDSAERFIELSASRSLLSGKPYRAYCPGQAAQESGDWLRTELQRYRDSGH